MEDGVALDLDEYVLRRAARNQIRSDGSLTRGVFTPNKNDTDGLSVYRETSAGGATPAELKTSGRKSPGEYIVVRISVRELVEELGLSVVTRADESGLSGHCVIPEFTYSAYNDKMQRERWIKVQESLCRIGKQVT